jgi:outer membrane protein assembly factor BamE (lipoprotein component of BamABCDE complex)
MVDDLLHRHRLRGMTREEVVSLLGTPPETNYFPDYDLVYWLGSERGYFSLGSEWWLAIKFGGNGRVSKTALVRE